MNHKGKIYFALYGDEFDPDEVTNLIGIKPTHIRHKGVPIPKHTIWKVSSEMIEADIVDVYDITSELVTQLLPYSERIAEAKRKFNLEAVLQVVLWIAMDESKSTPPIGFEPHIISFLSAVGAGIDVDTYLVPLDNFRPSEP